MRFANFKEIIQQVQNENKVTIGIAAAHEEHVLETIKQALKYEMIIPHLIGDKNKILNIAKKINLDLDNIAIYHTNSEEEAGYLTAKLANEGTIETIMKGFINSTPFLKGVLHKDFKLRTDTLLSHLSIFEIPDADKLFYMTDGGLNIEPNLEQKEQILKNAINFLKLIGIKKPKVAILSANERVSEKMKVTMEAKALVDKANQGFFGEIILGGPLPLDLAVSKESLELKGIESPVNGEADLVLVPTIEAGNILGKAITYFGHGKMAGIVLGAKVPLILNSRSDSIESKIASIALSALAVQKNS